jgi:hypothetical protein
MIFGKDFYKTIRIAGLVSYIPVVLATGPIGGYFLGEYVNRRFITNKHTTLFFALIGLLAGLSETFRVIRAIIKLGKR